MMQEQAEPSMDEILASIRQIISGDNQEAEKPAIKMAEEDVIELVDPIPEADNDFSPVKDELQSQPDQSESLVSASVFSETTQAFDELTAFAQSLPNEPIVKESQPSREQTVDALIKEMLKPLLREWLDANLPKVVRQVVKEQVDKVIQEMTNRK